MADSTNKVTIDAAWFAELYAAMKDIKQYAGALSNVVRERDELKRQLEKSKTNNMLGECIGNECATVKRLVAAERCIDAIIAKTGEFNTPDGEALIAIGKIICVYRENKEAK